MSNAAYTAAGKLLRVKLNGEITELAPGRLVSSLRNVGIKIPTVCWHPDIKCSGGRCRVCCCEVNGKVVPTCDIDVKEGMSIVTESRQLERDRDAALDLAQNCEVHARVIEEVEQEMATGESPLAEGKAGEKLSQGLIDAVGANGGGADEDGEVKVPLPQPGVDNIPMHKKSKYILRHPEKCVHCGLCVMTCDSVQGVGAIGDVRMHGGEGTIQAFHQANLADSQCASCGQCTAICPTGALEEASEADYVEAAFDDPNKIKVVQFAPAVRVALAEEFGYKPGERILTHEMVAATRALAQSNRDHVYVMDTNFTADLTIIEEGNELLERLRRALTGKRHLAPDHDIPTKLPMITSCSPGWVLFCEKNFPDLLDNLSTCKSPQGMAGSLLKHYWAEQVHPNRKKEDIVSISIMPCVAKKAERERGFADEGDLGGTYDVDHVLTTRDFAKLLRSKGIDPTQMKGEEFDLPLGIATGAAQIFGATGGVMEAALRTVYEEVTGRAVPYRRLNIVDVRGMEGVKEATVELRHVRMEYNWLEKVDVKVAVAHGLSNARKVMDRVRAAEEQGLPPPWHFVEIMCCPGGCIGGGGQPKPSTWATKNKRAKLIYDIDSDLPLRKSHENPAVKKLYRDYLKEPLGHQSHRLLHTTYKARVSEEASIMASADAKHVRENVLYKNKFPTNSRTCLTNMFSAVVDEYGWISDAAIAAIAGHVGSTPVAIDAICSHYHFFPRRPEHPESKVEEGAHDTTVWICDCLSCRTRGSRHIKHAMRKALDGTGVQVQTCQWLGWCQNNSPAAIVKHTHDSRLHGLYGLRLHDDDRYTTAEAIKSYSNPVDSVDFRVVPLDEVMNQLHPIDEVAEGKAQHKKHTNHIHHYNALRPHDEAEDVLTAEEIEARNNAFDTARPSVFSNIRLCEEDQQYMSEVGKCPVSRKIHQMDTEEILTALKDSGLRGCGGAGFPAHIKWRGCKDAKVNGAVESLGNSGMKPGMESPQKYVVINADEGLPSTIKDFAILSSPTARMRMIIGACTAARVIGAKTIWMYLRYEYKNLREDIEKSFEQYLTHLHPEAGADSTKDLKFRVCIGGGPYVCGEETAAFASLMGQAPQPFCHREKFITEQGLFGQPTLVNNVETLAWVPSILYYGAQRYADLGNKETGNEAERGAKLINLCGHVKQAALGEFPFGTTLADVLKVLAPDVPHDDIAAVEVGGVVERLIMGHSNVARALESPLTLDYRGYGDKKILPGAGSIVLYRRSMKFNAAEAMQAKAKYASKESCQLCAPCREGTRLFRKHVGRIITNPRSVWASERQTMLRLYKSMKNLSNCGHGKACGKMAEELLEDCVPERVADEFK